MERARLRCGSKNCDRVKSFKELANYLKEWSIKNHLVHCRIEVIIGEDGVTGMKVTKNIIPD